MFRLVALWAGLCACVVSVEGQKSHMLPDYSDHECIRPCKLYAKPMECRYEFVAESYSTLARACYNCTSGNVTDCRRGHCITTNGVKRNVLTINRIIPGPSIQVCQGDTVVVNVTSYMAMSEGISIHWHGILQKESPYMDGVSMLTQCPIPSGSFFQYSFHARDVGTHLWHAHAGVQRGEGLFGGFVIRVPKILDPQRGLYDFDLPEHVIVVNEWTNRPMDEVFTDASFAGIPEKPDADAILINGRADGFNKSLNLPRAVIRIQRGYRYRLRVINAGTLFCPIRISIDSHSLWLIASDGRPFVPFEVGSFDMLSAERYDFVLRANKKRGSFLLRARGLGDCEPRGLLGLANVVYVTRDDDHKSDDELEFPADGPAPESTGKIFSYWQMPARPVPQLNQPERPERGQQEDLGQGQKEPLDDSRSQLLAMDALAKDDASLLNKTDHQIFLHFSVRQVNNLHFYDPDLYPASADLSSKVGSPQINNITNRLGPVPLLSQRDEIPAGQLCNSSTMGDNCQGDWCECSHHLQVELNDVVEMVIISTFPVRGFTHPIHLHGFSFRVVAIDRLEEVMSLDLFKKLDKAGLIDRKLHLAPLKDTVALPNGGYVVIRFVADNIGVWFMHCHLVFHAELGMSLSLEVRDKNGSLPPAPKGFPRCSPFQLLEDSPQGKQLSVQEQADSQNKDSYSDLPAPKPCDHGAAPQEALPLWVLPLVVGLAIGVVALAITTFALWTRSFANSPRRWLSLPVYVTSEEMDQDSDAYKASLICNEQKQKL